MRNLFDAWCNFSIKSSNSVNQIKKENYRLGNFAVVSVGLWGQTWHAFELKAFSVWSGLESIGKR